MDAIEFGDFQTPSSFAFRVTEFLKGHGVSFLSAVEPTCGKGTFLAALIDSYSHEYTVAGFEIKSEYVVQARAQVGRRSASAEVNQLDFFQADWEEILSGLPEPLLLFGNPPWVTNSVQGSNGFTNLPAKSNFQKLKGFDAITGNSNFDISEWILIRLIEAARTKTTTMAFLIKTSVARKILHYANKSSLNVTQATIVNIDSKGVFDVSVDACLFLLGWDPAESNLKFEVEVFSDFEDPAPKVIGFVMDQLVENPSLVDEGSPILSQPPQKWRSGLKHDCSKVMELTREGDSWVNGFGETVEVEEEYLYPLLKSSDIANSRLATRKAVLVTQRFVGQQTDALEAEAPKLWRYLKNYEEQFTNRKSSIYRGKPEFSIFGVGDYSFMPYKIAISGLYKALTFQLLSPQNGKPVQVDDTVYTLSFDQQHEAEVALSQLQSQEYVEVLRSRIFWDEKRPIKASLLNQVNWSVVKPKGV
jgi:hypothetical protein